MGLADWWYVVQTTHLSRPAEHRELYRATRNKTILSVLELGIDDATRCRRLLAWLDFQQGKPPNRYAAIDLFEDAGHLSLKAFYSVIVAAGTKPMPVPGDLVTGLPRVAHTIGAVDLLIMDEPVNSIADPVARHFLPRVVHADSIIIAPDENDYLRQVEHHFFLDVLRTKEQIAA